MWDNSRKRDGKLGQSTWTFMYTTNIYPFKVNMETLEKDEKYVQR